MAESWTVEQTRSYWPGSSPEFLAFPSLRSGQRSQEASPVWHPSALIMPCMFSFSTCTWRGSYFYTFKTTP